MYVLNEEKGRPLSPPMQQRLLCTLPTAWERQARILPREMRAKATERERRGESRLRGPQSLRGPNEPTRCVFANARQGKLSYQVLSSSTGVAAASTSLINAYPADAASWASSRTTFFGSKPYSGPHTHTLHAHISHTPRHIGTLLKKKMARLAHHIAFCAVLPLEEGKKTAGGPGGGSRKGVRWGTWHLFLARRILHLSFSPAGTTFFAYDAGPPPPQKTLDEAREKDSWENQGNRRRY